MIRIVNLLSRRPFLPPENAERFLWKVKKYEFRRSVGESTASNQKEGYTAHSSAKPAVASWWNTDAQLANVARSSARNTSTNDDGGEGSGVLQLRYGIRR